MRWGLGPVFLYECLANARRWQTYAIRSVGVAILLAAIATIANSRTSSDLVNTWRDYAALGESYFYAIIGVELTLVLLAAPAATAGAICVDRAGGILTHMLATDLSDPEIVLGKLAARLLPILRMVACTWPVLAICSLLGGIDPTALTLAFAIILAVALLGCTMALALSVWARRPHEVVVVTYTFWMLVLLIWPVWYALSRVGLATPPWHWSFVVNPYSLAFARYVAPSSVDFWDYFRFFAVSLGLSAGLMIVAVWRMRPVACRGTVDRRKEPALGLVGRLTRWLPGPSLDRNPGLWREWHRSRPSRWLMILIAIVGGATGIACVAGAVMIWALGIRDFRSPPWIITGILGLVIQLIFGLLMLSAMAPTSMSEERQRGSLDVLATTTLSTRSIVAGKWLGMLRLAPLPALGPGLVSLALATAHNTRVAVPLLVRVELLLEASLLVATILVHGALIASVGVALAVWIKRQSRAIAASVAIAVMVSAGWPILVGVSRMGPASDGMMCLSPVMVAMAFGRIPSIGFVPRGYLFWWTAFWDIECLALALGLLWLTVRTFDRCLGRIPERPRRPSVLSDVIVLLAGLGGLGGLFGWIAIGINGLFRINPGLDYGALGCALLIAVGLLLLSVKAAVSVSMAGTSQDLGLKPSAPIRDRRWFAGRWWESFRLVLLLAIGPALLGLAVTTAYRPVRVVPNVKTLPDGSQEEIETDPFDGITRVVTRPPTGPASVRNATAAEIAARPILPVRSRTSLLSTAFLAVVTVLAHGAAVVSLGLAVGIGFRRRRLAIVASVGLVLFVTVGWPLLHLNLRAYLGYPPYTRGMTLASPIPAIVMLLHVIPAEFADMIAENLGWITFWDVLFTGLAVVVSALAIWTLERRPRACPSPEGNASDERPAIETVLVGD